MTLAPSAVTRVFTDGSNYQGSGGWAWVIPNGRYEAGFVPSSATNQTMELEAVIQAVRAIDSALIVNSDSAYVVNCMNDCWYDRWRANGWRNAQRKPVANRHQWEHLLELVEASRHPISFNHVPGHKGVYWNEQADLLAGRARKSRKGCSGVWYPGLLIR